MAQFEINIKMNDEDRVIVDATIPKGIELEKLLYGLWCHIGLIAEHLHEDKKRVIFMASMTDLFIEQNKDKVEEERTHVVLPKDIKEKEGQA